MIRFFPQQKTQPQKKSEKTHQGDKETSPEAKEGEALVWKKSKVEGVCWQRHRSKHTAMRRH